MKELKVIGVESGSLVLVSDEGDRYAVAIDDTLQTTLRPPLHPVANREKRVSPREIQAHIRAGLSADEVAELTGAALDYIARFEGPVTAEREHIVASALGVRVYATSDPDPLEEGTAFGDVIRDRLASLSADGEQWSSWKDEEQGWIVKLLFTSDRIDHDARWSFDPKKSTLAPITPEATTLSQQGEIRPTLIPRLRAVIPAAVDERATRFDTDAFAAAPTAPKPAPVPDAHDTAPQPAAAESVRTQAPFQRAATVQNPEQRERDLANTSDLLDALRRRRGEREHTSFSPVREEFQPTEVTLPTLEPAPSAAADHPSNRDHSAPQRSTGSAQRRGRTSMPSWDEIVFGARSDE
ncbi:DUF3071 domain-containing protein [Microbacteriaceae bacterium VKM Ac-2855]|nr:DUF3071 domain-containing protein [Microbacteriaceae bacterium VKM Ac-2855]